MRRAFVWAALSAAVALPAAGDGTTTNTFDEVAETSVHPPGMPAGVTYSAIQYPITDGAGTFLFESQLDGGGLGAGFEDAGLFVGKRDTVTLVARAGFAAPGAGGLMWSKLSGAGQILRPSGKLAFPGELSGADPTAKGGIWTGSAGNLALLVREGDPAPGTTVNFGAGANYFQDGFHVAMNDTGAVALRAQLAGASVTAVNDTALFSGTPGALTLVARLGDAAPDAGGATFVKSGTETFTSPSINGPGKILFRGHLTGTGVTPTNADAIWFGDPAAPTIAARGGQTVTGTGIPANSTLAGVGTAAPVLNDAGKILFEAPYAAGSNSVSCVWLGAPGAFACIAAAGQAVPGDAQNATLAGPFLHLRLNGDGHAAFHAMLSTGTSDWALLAWDGSAIHAIWRSGAQAPGMPTGELFDNNAPTGDVFLDASGKVLFRAVTTPSLIQGIWLADPSANSTQLIARTGIDATIGTASKMLSDVTLFSGSDALGDLQDGRGSPLGDDGTFAILGQTADAHVEVLTNATSAGPGPGPGPSGPAATPSSLSVGTSTDVTGTGFGGGAAKFHAPKAWLTVGSSPRKIPLRVDPSTASDTEFHATLASLPKGAHGDATLHVLPHVKHATEITIPVTIELPSVTSLSATDLHGGDTLTITGEHFGSKKKSVEFRGSVNGKPKKWKLAVKSWSDESIMARLPKKVVPKGSTSLEGDVVVITDAGESTPTTFTVDG
jgi:hypothetical protein